MCKFLEICHFYKFNCVIWKDIEFVFCLEIFLKFSLKDSRYQLLVLKPSKMSWIGYASAYHLLKEYDVALYILGEFKKNNRVI